MTIIWQLYDNNMIKLWWKYDEYDIAGQAT